MTPAAWIPSSGIPSGGNLNLDTTIETWQTYGDSLFDQVARTDSGMPSRRSTDADHSGVAGAQDVVDGGSGGVARGWKAEIRQSRLTGPMASTGLESTPSMPRSQCGGLRNVGGQSRDRGPGNWDGPVASDRSAAAALVEACSCRRPSSPTGVRMAAPTQQEEARTQRDDKASPNGPMFASARSCSRR